MLFLNIGDGYSSGCCTGSKYFTANTDPFFQGAAPLVEHPDSRPGSFINQLSQVWKANVITFARHRTTIEEILHLKNQTIELIKAQNAQTIVFFGIPNLYSQILNDEYLVLDGHDISNDLLDEELYANLCQTKEDQDITNKIQEIETFIQEISKIVYKVIIYRTTCDSIELSNLPSNVINTDLNIVDKLLENYKPYRRGYFDTRAYGSLKKEFIHLL